MLRQSGFFTYSAVVLILTCQGQNTQSQGLPGLLSPLFGQIGTGLPLSPRLCGNCLCGRPNSAFRLLGGSSITEAQYPWLVLIYVGTNTTTGTLITNRYVITAATPLQGATIFDVRVSLGQSSLCAASVEGLNVSASNVIIHPAYDSQTNSNDLALIRLNIEVPLSPRIISVCLPPSSRATYFGRSATIVSWNVNNTNMVNSALTCRARQIQLTVANPRDCFQANVSAISITAEKGCVGSVGTPSLICPADAGAPVLVRTEGGTLQLIGIVTAVNNCADGATGPSLMTNIPPYMRWIFQNIADSCLCSARVSRFNF